MTKQKLGWVLLLFVVWRGALALFAHSAQFWLPYEPSFPYATDLLPSFGLSQAWYSWANFDGVHYLTILEKGYKGTGLIQAFFPGYPLLVHIFSRVIGNDLLAGLIISNLATFAFMVIWIDLFTKKFNSRTAWLSLIILMVFPTSFFWATFYSESLFMLLVLGAFWAEHHKSWKLAAVLAALASETRIVGIALVPALLLAWLAHENVSFSQLSSFLKKNWLTGLTLLGGSAGLLSYMLFLWYVFGDPLYFLHVQSEFGAGRQESLVIFPQVVWRYIKILVTYQPHDLKYLSIIQELVFSLLTGLGLLIGWYKKIPVQYILFSAICFIIPTLTGTFSSMPRYILVCFPLYILLAQGLENRRWLFWAYLVGSILLLSLNTMLFIQGYWVA
jgi:hypothetical protein